MEEQPNKNQGKELEEIINSVSDFTPTKKVIGINNQFVFMIDNNRKKISIQIISHKNHFL